MTTQIFDVEEEWIKKRKDTLLDMEGERGNQICSFMWTDSSWIMSHSKENSEQMSRDLVEEASRWDLEPKPASLWWTSTCASEEKNDMISGTLTGCYKFPFEDTFNILGCAMNRWEKTCDVVEERMRSANKAFQKDIVIHKSQDVPWKAKCQRLVDRVYVVFAFGSENWTWTSRRWKRSKDGKPRQCTLIPFQKK